MKAENEQIRESEWFVVPRPNRENFEIVDLRGEPIGNIDWLCDAKHIVNLHNSALEND